MACVAALICVPTLAPCLSRANADPVPASGRLIAKMTFERPDSLAEWRIEKNDPSVEISLDSTFPHSGVSSLKFHALAPVEKQADAFAGAKLSGESKGRRLRIRMFARTDGAVHGDVALCVLERGKNGVIGWLNSKAQFIQIDAGAKWTEYQAEGPVSADATGLTLELMLSRAGAGRTVWVDDLSVEEVAG